MASRIGVRHASALRDGWSVPPAGTWDTVDESHLTERFVDAAEFAEVLGVSEDDVLEWMLNGHISYVEGPQGQPLVRISSAYSAEGPLFSWEMNYSVSAEPAFRAELARRRREHELAALDWGGVDVEALAAAFANRLRVVVPSGVAVSVDGAMVFLHDAQGHGAGIDIAGHASFPQNGSGPDRVRAAALSALRSSQDELAEVTTDPWPQHGPGQLPDPHAEITPDGETVRLFYGDSPNQVLELEPLRIADVLRTSTS
jgi:hypothetical protein